jgi:hypothetical protein
MARVADLDMGSGTFSDPWIRIRYGTNPDQGSQIRDKHPESHFEELSTNFLVLKY